MKKQYKIILRNLKWHNKLWISAKEKFVQNVIYTDELKNRLSIARFIWNQKIIILLLLLPVILLPILAWLFIKQPTENEIYKVNIFDITSTILTYAMPTFLAFVVWHYTWLQKREKENESAIRVYADILMNEKNNNYLFTVHEDITGIKICFTNQNPIIPIKLEFLKVFHQERGSVHPLQHRFISFERESNLLGFNETETFLIGFDSSFFEKIQYFKHPYEHLYFVFYITNAYGHKVYCVIKSTIDKSGWVSTVGNEAILIEHHIFKQLKEKFGYYFLKEIVWYSPVGLRKTYVNRVHLCKKVKIKNKNVSKNKKLDSSNPSTE